MKIAIWYNLHSGGGKRALYDQAAGLKAQGHTVEFWSPPVPQKDYLPLGAFGEEHILPLKFSPDEAPGIVSRLLKKNRMVPRKLAALESHCRECAAQINRGDFDLLLAHPCHYVAASPIARFVELPSILYLHEPYRTLYESNAQLPWCAPEDSLASFPQKQIESLRDTLKVNDFRLQVREEQCNAAAFSRILVNSYFSREAILRAYGLDSHVSYLGIDTALFRNLGLEREPFVIGLGSYVASKNQELAIRALAKVPEPRPRLIWVGNFIPDPDYLEALKKLAAHNGVEFEPKVLISDEELLQLLNRASMMLYLSRLEPFGYAPLEANSCGTPVIAIAEGGMRETIVDGVNGKVTDPHPEAIAASIVSLRDHPVLLGELRKSSSRWVEENWSLASASARLQQHLQEVVALGNANKKIASLP